MRIVLGFLGNVLSATFLAILTNVIFIVGFIGVDAPPQAIATADLPLATALAVLALATIFRSTRRLTIEARAVA